MLEASSYLRPAYILSLELHWLRDYGVWHVPTYLVSIARKEVRVPAQGAFFALAKLDYRVLEHIHTYMRACIHTYYIYIYAYIYYTDIYNTQANTHTCIQFL